ncbi:50S ribosomal protein L29 [Candidatus Jorgensenbacteria bacterium GWA1_49_17]|uniref:Large ribosomal subunit protein uL29 n=2 Tax=Candidatus Joergenseniibacteriota TaxID=1752739 RepID=A0A1F6BPZ2_9BACT|nr:MAG: 50S ribosomal protein L29 [Candidatus Jorgensenbacteria bacterium GWC1_48_12]OGG40495.1 MAG: 50S ribosomal protein L29 [Candidatus Jorgensenbacteria bacterium GWA1_49_17]
MKKKELENLKNKTMVEIDKELRECQERLLNLKADLALGKVKNIHEMKELKKSVAQLLTIKNLREEIKV